MSAWSGDPSLLVASSGFPTTMPPAPPRGRRPRSVAERWVAWRRCLPVLALAGALGAAAGGAWPSAAPVTWEATAVLRLPVDPAPAPGLSRVSRRPPASRLVALLRAAPLQAAGRGVVLSLRPLPGVDPSGHARLELRLAGPDARTLLPALQALGERARREWAARAARERGVAEALPRADVDLPAWASPPSADALHPLHARAGFPVLGALAGLLLSALAVAARARGADRLRDERDVQWSLGVDVLGHVPPLGPRARQAFAPPEAPVRPQAGTPD